MGYDVLTIEYLLGLFDYDRNAGTLVWKNHWCKSTRTRLVGKTAGNTKRQKGSPDYTAITLEGKQYLAHRLIFFIENGKWCDQVDHIDGNGTNNKITNLRASNQQTNQRNKKIHRAGKSPGYHYCKETGRYRAQLRTGNKRISLGRYGTPEEASRAYLNELKRRKLL